MNPQDLFNKVNSAKSAQEAQAPNISLLHRFGISPVVAAVFFFADWVLFGGELISGPFLIPIAIAVGVVLAMWSAKKQQAEYGDCRKMALIKGIVLGILTAIPSPMGSFVALLAGVLPILERVIPNLTPSSEGESKDKDAMRNVTPSPKPQDDEE